MLRLSTLLSYIIYYVSCWEIKFPEWGWVSRLMKIRLTQSTKQSWQFPCFMLENFYDYRGGIKFSQGSKVNKCVSKRYSKVAKTPILAKNINIWTISQVSGLSIEGDRAGTQHSIIYSPIRGQSLSLDVPHLNWILSQGSRIWYPSIGGC